jgi:hypothetical protein
MLFVRLLKEMKVSSQTITIYEGAKVNNKSMSPNPDLWLGLEISRLSNLTKFVRAFSD